MRKLKVFLSALLITVTSVAFAQKITVTGVVTDASNGEPLSGAAILVKGTPDGTVADIDGRYSISVSPNATLGFTTIGFKDVEVQVNGRTEVNVKLEPDSEMLDDVIVVAYGTVRREAATGSVSSMKTEELAKAPSTSIEKMLQGKVAGVEISSNSGQPGSNTTIRVRGTSSINAGNEPLWVVDGIPIMASDTREMGAYGDGAGGSNTSFINPNDIESITILKDAAAASVYGSRAANGVILVTTKSGKAGKSRFTARAKVGATQLANDNNYRPMTGLELVNYWRDAAVNGGYNPDDPASDFYVPYSLLENGTHSWYDDLTKIGMLQEYEINATGGSDKFSYYSSASYNSNDGVFYGLGMKRFTARVNADYQLTKMLKTGVRVAGTYTDSKQNIVMGSSYYNNPAYAMFNLLPWTPLYNEDGTFSQPAENSGINPRAIGELNDYFDKEYRFNGNMYFEFKPIRQLTVKSNNSIEMAYTKTRMYDNPAADPDEVASLQTIAKDNIRLTTSNTITYADLFGKHSVRALVGQEAMKQTFEGVGVYSPNVDPAIPYPTTSTSDQDEGIYSNGEETLLSFFGVFDYNFDNRYFLSASVRGDGSSLFGRNKKWGAFWSVSGSWNISNEKFLSSTRNWLSELKLRLSYGVNGNNNIGSYMAYGTYGTGQYNGATYYAPSTPSNEDLSWEKNKTWNVGLDFGFFDNRLTGTVDVYNRLTTDMLLAVTVPYTTGFGSNLRNIGALENKGVEFAVNGEIIRSKDWRWSVGANIAFNRSKVLDLAGSEFLTCSDYRVSSGNSTPVRIVEGMSLYNFYIREYAGVNPSNGEGLFVTDDGTLSPDRTIGHYIYAGSPEPKFTGGFNTQLSWKGITLSTYFQFVYGNKVLVGNWYTTDGEDVFNQNSTADALNYWKKPGDTGVLPVPIAGGNNVWYAGYSTRFLQDGSYLRIKDVTLSYDLCEKALKAMRLKGLKLYVSAVNPYTFHHVSALDPEFGELGYAYGGNHSMTKSIIGGIEITF